MVKKKKINKNKQKIIERKKFQFLNRWYFAVWVVIIISTLLISYAFSMRCTDGVKINADGIMRACGVSVDEFYRLTDINDSFCMDGWTYVRAVGECGPDIKIMLISALATSVVYNLAYAIYYFISRKKNKKKVRKR
ncbi:MAG: hypothetical protein ACP5NZ_02155 [Nanobdellota archaeon]